MNTPIKTIIIFGPTGSGKTSLSIKLAKYIFGKHNLESEIINIDSRQIYKGMDIGTSKIEKEFTDKYPHHLIDILDLKEEVSAVEFAANVEEKAIEINQNGNFPMLVGGTGSHFLEMFHDKYYQGQWKTDHKVKNEFDTMLLIPKYDRQSLYHKIDNVVDRMVKKGLYKEVRKLIKEYGSDNEILMNTIGYREFITYSERNNKNLMNLYGRDIGRIKALIKQNTHKYAMHQDNLIKKLRNYTIVRDVSNIDPIKQQIDDFLG